MEDLVMRKCISLLLVFSLVMGTISFSAADVSAASVKLSNKSVTIAKGGGKTIKLSRGKGKWTIVNAGVAKLKSVKGKSVRVVPVKAGKTLLVCKVKGKKLKCKIRVLNNKIGKISKAEYEKMGFPLEKGKKISDSFTLSEGWKYKQANYNKKKAKVTVKKNGQKYKFTVRALKPGRAEVSFIASNGDLEDSMKLVFNIYNGFRGKAKASKTKNNYKKWRSKWISQCVSKEMTTWEIIDMLGTMISSGKYSYKNGTKAISLWYKGTGTCVSGAQMMNDFLRDMGINSKTKRPKNQVRNDIFGYTVMYGSSHMNTQIKLGGKKYTLNPQPGARWPVGIVRN